MTTLQEDKQPSLKMGKGPEQTLLQGGHTEGPQTHKRMLSITSHQRDAKGWEAGMTQVGGKERW